MRGGFTLHVTMVRENRAYLTTRKVDVPWTNKKLTVKWEHFVSKLEPGQKETWTAVITGPDAKKAVAEMVAALYDQSLDAYLPHAWTQASTSSARTGRIAAHAVRELGQVAFNSCKALARGSEARQLTYRSLPAEHHGEPVGIWVLRRAAGGMAAQAAAACAAA